MTSLGDALPTRTERDRRWAAAIASALRAGLRHTPECFARGAIIGRTKRPVFWDEISVPGCPWCEHIRAQVEPT
jgi:hypothetical protein